MQRLAGVKIWKECKRQHRSPTQRPQARARKKENAAPLLSGAEDLIMQDKEIAEVTEQWLDQMTA